MSRGSTLLPMLTISLLGLSLVAAFALSPPSLREEFVFRKPFIGSMFALVCILGIIAVFFPNQCSKTFDREKTEQGSLWLYGFKRRALVSQGNSALNCEEPSVLLGHHPSCGCFSSHVFRLNGKIFCATCSGLLIGALVVLAGTAVYFFGNWQIGQQMFSMVWIGMIGVAIGLLQPLLLNIHRSGVRVFSGGFLAVGSFLILAGIDELAHNTFLDVFLVFLILFWLMSRISLSQWEHEKACAMCSLPSCPCAGARAPGV